MSQENPIGAFANQELGRSLDLFLGNSGWFSSLDPYPVWWSKRLVGDYDYLTSYPRWREVAELFVVASQVLEEG